MIDKAIQEITKRITKHQHMPEDGNEEDIYTALSNFFELTVTENYEILRTKLDKLSGELHSIGTPAVVHLLLVYMDFYKLLSTKETKKTVPVEGEIQPEIVIETIKAIYEDPNLKEISMLDFKLPVKIDNINTVYSSFREIQTVYTQQPIDEHDTQSDISSRMLSYCVSRELSKQLGCTNEFYMQYKGFIGLLNRQSYYQQARDFSENGLVCSYIDGHENYGLLIYFECFVQQNNIIDSLLFGTALLKKLNNSTTEINSDIYNETVFTCFTLLRNFKQFDYAKGFYRNYIDKIDLDEYDLQRFNNAYFYVLIATKDKNALYTIDEYIHDNYNNIVKYGNHSIVPVYNLILQVKKIKGYDSTRLESVEKKLRLELGDAAEKNTYCPSGVEDIKSMLISQINKVSKTRDINDLVSETNIINVTANSALRLALKDNDVGLYLLSHLVMSDVSLNIKRSPILSAGLVSTNDNFDIPSDLAINNYVPYVLSFLSLSKECSYIWLSSVDDKIIILTYSAGSFSKIQSIDGCSMSSIREWKKIVYPNLGYDDTYDYDGKKESYRYVPDELVESRCNDFFESLPGVEASKINKKSVIFQTNELSIFPPNLIRVSNKELISNNSTVISPLGFTNYVKTRFQNTKVSTEKIYLWAPIHEQDMAINMAYSTLSDEISNYNIIIDNKRIPDSSVMTDINIFIAHGGSGYDGLTGIFPNSDEVYSVDSKALFSTGKVAILFICHSGSSGKSLFFNKTNTLIKQLLNNGYEATIAPFWSLNVKIPGIWTKEFLYSLELNMSIDESVLMANIAVKNEYKLPTAWACMHMFGNNNITATINSPKC